MGARRSRRPSDLGGFDEDADIVRQAVPKNQGNGSTITPRRPLQLAKQPIKPAQGGRKDRAGRRKPSKQASVPAENDAGNRRIVVVGEKATALPRADADAGRDPARREVSNGYMLDATSHCRWGCGHTNGTCIFAE